MTNRIQQLQDKHTWLTDTQAQFILATRYWTFTREMGMEGATLNAAMDNAVKIYTRLPEDAMRDMMARFEERFIT